MLIPNIRSIFDQIAAFPNQSARTDLELNGVTAGQVADLCKMQQAARMDRQQQLPPTPDGGTTDEAYYKPINVYTLSVLTKLPDAEEARMATRLYDLKKTLQKFGGMPP